MAKKRTDACSRAELALAWELVISTARAFIDHPGAETFTALLAAMEERDKLADRTAEALVDEDAG